MQNSTTRIAAIGGNDFIAYTGPDGSVFMERVRPSGVRDANSIFQFDAKCLLLSIWPLLMQAIFASRNVPVGKVLAALHLAE